MSPRNSSWEAAGFNGVLAELKSRSFYTPDLRSLEDYEEHIVFVYDNFKKDLDDHIQFLNKAKFLGRAFTVKDDFLMKRTVNYPVVFDTVTHKGKKKIIGEAYAVNVEEIRKLDALFGNGTLWTRRKEYISLREQESPFKNGITRPTVEAWMYIGNEECWENHGLMFSNVTIEKGVSCWIWNPNYALVSD